VPANYRLRYICQRGPSVTLDSRLMYHCTVSHKSTIYYTYTYVHKVDEQRINIKWRAWPQARLAKARLSMGPGPGSL